MTVIPPNEVGSAHFPPTDIPASLIAVLRREFRTHTEPFEIRAVDDPAGQQTVTGHAAVFNKPANIAGLFDEVVAPGAFTRTLAAGDDLHALFNHDFARVLGRRSAGTLRAKEDDVGLAVEIDLPDHAADVREMVSRKDVDQMSFGFHVREETWTEPAEGSKDFPLRTLVAVDVFDVSIVARGAYEETDVSLRAFETWAKERGDLRELYLARLREREERLRDIRLEIIIQDLGGLACG